ncbi:hypothetical protein HHL11_27345 [Ramlibacter sp. G-1-2-2]|uniref:Uncharacterized protein n=1 Tax=Ramlibacter agri TaxID=2728837 RepID=A0A848H936_9BURK|nr:hypothetical protein [Ramlibacter agri]NML47496.1 hypothetical protein [Ramlibacter agri]
MSSNATAPQAFLLLRKINGQVVTTVGPASDIEDTFDAMGYEYLGSLIDANLPGPLQGAPRFAGLAGPRLEGEALLYVAFGTTD